MIDDPPQIARHGKKPKDPWMEECVAIWKSLAHPSVKPFMTINTMKKRAMAKYREAYGWTNELGEEFWIKQKQDYPDTQKVYHFWTEDDYRLKAEAFILMVLQKQALQHHPQGWDWPEDDQEGVNAIMLKSFHWHLNHDNELVNDLAKAKVRAKHWRLLSLGLLDEYGGPNAKYKQMLADGIIDEDGHLLEKDNR